MFSIAASIEQRQVIMHTSKSSSRTPAAVSKQACTARLKVAWRSTSASGRGTIWCRNRPWNCWCRASAGNRRSWSDAQSDRKSCSVSSAAAMAMWLSNTCVGKPSSAHNKHQCSSFAADIGCNVDVIIIDPVQLSSASHAKQASKHLMA